MKWFPLSLLLTIITVNFIFADETRLKYQSSISELKKKAEYGDPKALFDLARIYDLGFDTISVDSAKSTKLYILSAEKGYPQAMNYLGFRYFKGEYINQNKDSALYWIKKAAEAGDITAAANLAYILTEVPENDSIKNSIDIYNWMLIAAEAGLIEPQLKIISMMRENWRNMSPDSVLALGIKYYTGKAPIMGIELIKIASDTKIPKALALMGDAYSKGKGLSYDYKKSTEYFVEAAFEGDPSAQFIIAEQLDFFPDSFQEIPFFKNQSSDKKTATYWYEKAAEGGVFDAESAYTLLISPH